MLAGTLLGVPREGEPPVDRPLWVPPVTAPVEKPMVTRRSLFPVPGGPTWSKQVVRASASTLEVTARPAVRRRRPKPVPTVTLIDLTAVAVRAESGDSPTSPASTSPTSTWTTLIDRDDRRVTLAWPAYRNPAPLRALVDAATPPATRMTVPVSAATTTALLSRRKKFRKGSPCRRSSPSGSSCC